MIGNIFQPVFQATALLVAVTWFSVAGPVASVVAGGHQQCCPECGTTCGHLVECVVMVPMTVTETRVKNVVVKKQVEREEEYTVFRQVAETRQFTKKFCYLDDEVKSKQITCERCQIVEIPTIQTFRVKVPVCEEETHVVPTEQCIDGQVVVVEEPCTKAVWREREEVREQECTRPQLVFDTKKCTIDYCVKTPKTHEVPCMEETYLKLVPETRTRTVTVCVPQIERVTYDVQVTKMFPKTVSCCPHCAAKHRRPGGR
jgi:hypothetical protein